eukprot:tig00000852_g5028.t1
MAGLGIDEFLGGAALDDDLYIDHPALSSSVAPAGQAQHNATLNLLNATLSLDGELAEALLFSNDLLPDAGVADAEMRDQDPELEDLLGNESSLECPSLEDKWPAAIAATGPVVEELHVDVTQGPAEESKPLKRAVSVNSGLPAAPITSIFSHVTSASFASSKPISCASRRPASASDLTIFSPKRSLFSEDCGQSAPSPAKRARTPASGKCSPLSMSVGSPTASAAHRRSASVGCMSESARMSPRVTGASGPDPSAAVDAILTAAIGQYVKRDPRSATASPAPAASPVLGRRKSSGNIRMVTVTQDPLTGEPLVRLASAPAARIPPSRGEVRRPAAPPPRALIGRRRIPPSPAAAKDAAARGRSPSPSAVSAVDEAPRSRVVRVSLPAGSLGSSPCPSPVAGRAGMQSPRGASPDVEAALMGRTRSATSALPAPRVAPVSCAPLARSAPAGSALLERASPPPASPAASPCPSPALRAIAGSARAAATPVPLFDGTTGPAGGGIRALGLRCLTPLGSDLERTLSLQSPKPSFDPSFPPPARGPPRAPSRRRSARSSTLFPAPGGADNAVLVHAPARNPEFANFKFPEAAPGPRPALGARAPPGEPSRDVRINPDFAHGAGAAGPGGRGDEGPVGPATCEREARVLRPAAGGPDPGRFEVPDDFFEFTVEDLAIVQRAAHASDGDLLLTRKLREEMEARRRRRYAKCLIRVRFPDRFVLQGTFAARERVADVYDFVRQRLAAPRPFYLYVAPPVQRVAESGTSVHAAGLTPATLLNFAFEGAPAPPRVAPPRPTRRRRPDGGLFLREALLATAEDLTVEEIPRARPAPAPPRPLTPPPAGRRRRVAGRPAEAAPGPAPPRRDYEREGGAAGGQGDAPKKPKWFKK